MIQFSATIHKLSTDREKEGTMIIKIPKSDIEVMKKLQDYLEKGLTFIVQELAE